MTTSPTAAAEVAAAMATSAATKDEGMMTAVRTDMAASVVKREVDTVEESVVKRAVDMVEASAARNLEVMAETSVVRNPEAMAEVNAVKNMVNVVKRVEAMVAANVVTKAVDTEEASVETTVPAAATQEAVMIDARSRQDTVIDQAVDTAALQGMAETQTKSRDVQRLNATTAAQAVVMIGQVEAREDMVETTPTTVPQGAPVALLTVAATQAMEATQAPTQANSHLARPTAAAMVVRTTSLALFNTLNLVVVAQAMPTSSAWLSVF
jgi:hypothetical protein